MRNDDRKAGTADVGYSETASGVWKSSDSGKRYRKVMGATTLCGDRVRNSAGENLGKIEELMIDLPSGRVAYAVLSFGGFMGMGDKLFAVPWSKLTVDEDNHEFVLDVDKRTLENAPGFDKDNWPDMADPDWNSQIRAHYGTESESHAGEQVGATNKTWDSDRLDREPVTSEGTRRDFDVTEKSYKGGGGA